MTDQKVDQVCTPYKSYQALLPSLPQTEATEKYQIISAINNTPFKPININELGLSSLEIHK